MLKPIAMATFVAGSLDLLFAVVLTVAFGRAVPDMLRYVASGPFPSAAGMGTAGAILGLVVHYALMALMASAYFWFARGSRRKHLFEMPIRAGIAFGIVTYFLMNWLVVPLRFGTPLPPRPLSIATQLFAHVVLVGIPIAWIARRALDRPGTQ